jgi:hypothetical protein
MTLHTDAVAKDGAMGERAGGIDSDDSDSFIGLANRADHLIDKGAFPRTGRASNAYDQGTAGLRKERGDQGTAGRRLIFNQRGGACERAKITGKNLGAKARDL